MPTKRTIPSKKDKQKFKLKNQNAQYFYEELMKVSPAVAAMLKEDIPSRDDDNRLLFKIWKKYGAKDTDTVKKLRYMVIMGKLPKFETIRRSRQMLQEKYPELRGTLYKQRHDAEVEVRNQMKFPF